MRVFDNQVDFHFMSEKLLFAHEDAAETNTNQMQKEEKETSRIKE